MELFPRVRHGPCSWTFRYRRPQGVHGLMSRQPSAGIAFAREPHRKAYPQPGQFLLGQVEVDEDRVENCSVTTGFPSRRIWPRFTCRDAQAAAERRADRFFLARRRGRSSPGQRLLVPGNGGIVLRLGNDLFRQHPDVSLEDGLCSTSPEPRRREAGPLPAGILADQEIPPNRFRLPV